MDIKLKLGQRVPKSAIAPYKYREYTDADAFTKPCAIILGGGGVNEDEHANGLCKRMQLLLGRENIYEDDIRIFGITYPYNIETSLAQIRLFSDISLSGARLWANQETPLKTYDPPSEIKDFVAHYMLPLVAQNGQMDKEHRITGQRLNMAAAKKNLRNLNFVTHCYGGVVANQISDVLANMLQQLKYSPDEIKELAAQIFVLSLANITPLQAGKPARFTTLHITNIADEITNKLQFQNSSQLTLQELARRRLARQDKDCAVFHPNQLLLSQITPDIENEWVVSVPELLPIQRMRIDNNTHDPSSSGWYSRLDYDQHQLDTFILPGYNDEWSLDTLRNGTTHSDRITLKPIRGERAIRHGFMLPSLIAFALRNAVQDSWNCHASDMPHSPQLTPEFLLQMPNSAKICYKQAPQDAYSSLARASGYVNRIENVLNGTLEAQTPNGPAL